MKLRTGGAYHHCDQIEGDEVDATPRRGEYHVALHGNLPAIAAHQLKQGNVAYHDVVEVVQVVVACIGSVFAGSEIGGEFGVFATVAQIEVGEQLMEKNRF